jgi:class 3 adenylate cyclase
MALRMRDCIAKLELAEPVQVRIGVHTGPVVAGVIGKRKFIYDVWGDTVNTASRMESHGVPGAIQVSEETYRATKHLFEYEPRGVVTIKGKGDMPTYLLIERRAPSEGRVASLPQQVASS